MADDTKSKEKSTQSGATSTTAAADMLSEMQKAGLGSLAWLGTTWVEKMSDLGAEWMDFLAKRIKEDVDLGHSLLHSTNAETMQKVQAEFLQKAAEQYQQETGKLMSISDEMMESLQQAVDGRS